ncbi:hypothetical protein [Sphingomonas lenta]|uniref:DUF4892 domain-containing protein n=1 Tax=Sphingomonas lenta TaxID=1141887 RepID=A0A2A2SJC3_9SPHN|nr:hypothetical protein [Sphingomonas lenta]PAX09384.1 hypothetical protein CKY28_01115 [Sphingomonas lenta]
MRRLALLAALTAASPALAQQEIVPPPGAVAYKAAEKDFDQVRYATIERGQLAGPTVEGPRRWTVYQGPRQGSGSFSVFRHLQSQAAQAGYTTVYTCTRTCSHDLFYKALGGLLGEEAGAIARAGSGSIEDRNYLVARRERADGTDWLRIATIGSTLPVAFVDQTFARR